MTEGYVIEQVVLSQSINPPMRYILVEYDAAEQRYCLDKTQFKSHKDLFSGFWVKITPGPETSKMPEYFMVDENGYIVVVDEKDICAMQNL